LKKLALLSVSDKTKIIELALSLTEAGYEIIATGNTSRLLKEKGIGVTDISSYTGSAEIFDGRVKTLHPKIFGGILYRRNNPSDASQAAESGLHPIDIVCVNLYPFVKTAENPSSSLDDVIENIDIGGPSLIRASAKNYKDVAVLTSPSQYEPFLEELKSGCISEDTKKKLAVAAFSHTAQYDTYISNFLENKFGTEKSHFRINYPSIKTLRYGENPHQSAALYGNFFSYFEIMHGKELSYNNILDLISAVELTEDLGQNSCVIIKHNNPAGASTAANNYEAYLNALKCDPVSAFGGIVAFNSEVDETLALKLNEIFLEVISAPSYTPGALKLLEKKKDRRLLKQLKQLGYSQSVYRNIPGGVIAQTPDNITLDENNLKVVTTKTPTEEQLADLKFAWIIAKHTKSNAIVFVKNKTTLGVGAGQMSRLDSAKIASMKAKEHGHDLSGSVASSDAFFPFADGLLEIINHGAVSVIQPGGSVRDAEVIDAANSKGISMVFTGVRHFKH
jgi:phosphoribosylaminoimidazolecarboxamide formyltransferase/IMP cyclohydrolase